MRIGNKEFDLPVIQGGMGVGVSLGNLAGNVAKNGGIGVISSVNCGYKEPDFEKDPLGANLRALKNEIAKAREISEGNGLVAVNLMCAVTHYEEYAKAAVEAGADAIISGAGLPIKLPAYTKDTGTLYAPIVSSGKAADLLVRQYMRRFSMLPDFFVLEGHLAGGHLGFSREELESGSAKDNTTILKEVLEVTEPLNIPVFVAGGVFTGEDVEYFMNLGAAGVQLGTRFIATKECDAHENFKNVIVKAQKEDICLIKSPVGMPARAVKTPLLTRLAEGKTFGPKRCSNCLAACPKGDKVPYCISRALIEAVNGNVEEGLFFTGANGERITGIQTVKEVLSELYPKAFE